MVRLLLPDELARLPACAHVLAAKGRHARYLGDAAIRHYAERTLSELAADLGEPLESARISGGVGLLEMTHDGNAFTPAPAVAAQAGSAAGALLRAGVAAITGADVLASAEVIVSRRALCDACPKWVDGRCAGCGCNTAVKTTMATERCPDGKW